MLMFYEYFTGYLFCKAESCREFGFRDAAELKKKAEKDIKDLF
jgi:hypothetical protein